MCYMDLTDDINTPSRNSLTEESISGKDAYLITFCCSRHELEWSLDLF